MSFQKIHTKKKSVSVAEQIMGAIQKGEYQIGEKLPSERQMAQQTGVSRASVREALSALELAGAIKSKSGDGIYVCHLGESASTALHVSSILWKNESPFEVLEVRKILEPAIAELAADRATLRDIQRMKEALAEMHRAVAIKDESRFHQADQEFHMGLARATHNSALEHSFRPIIDILVGKLWRQMKRDILADQEHMRDILASHERILINIEKKEGNVAREEVKKHFQITQEYLLGDEGGGRKRRKNEKQIME